MFKSMGLKFKIILGSCVTLVLMVALGFVSINANKALTISNQLVDHTHIVIATANEIVAAGVDMETGMRGYLLAGQEEFLGPYKGGQKKFYELVESLSKTVNDNPAQVQLLSEVKTNIDAWQKDVTEVQIALRRQIGDAKTMNDMADLVGEAKGKASCQSTTGFDETSARNSIPRSLRLLCDLFLLLHYYDSTPMLYIN